MKNTLFVTEDGSNSVFNETLQETYHSKYGAVKESLHVFIAAGLQHLLQKGYGNIRIFEMGFGTGLNVLLTNLYKEKADIQYTSIELYPLSEEIMQQLNYQTVLTNSEIVFSAIKNAKWEQETVIDDDFTLEKKAIALADFESNKKYDLIYYDAFAPEIQAELWTESVFEKMYNLLNDNGILVTYCAKGSVRRAMQKAGFKVERLPGPPPKREMLRASRSLSFSLEL